MFTEYIDHAMRKAHYDDGIDLNTKFHAETDQEVDSEWDKLEEAATRAQSMPEFND